MAASLIFISSLLAAEFTGRVQMLWLVLGLAGLISLLYSKSGRFGILLGICALGMTGWISRDWITTGIAITMLFLLRCWDNERRVNAGASFERLFFWGTMGIFGCAWGWPLVQVMSLTGIATALPVFRINAPPRLCLIAFFAGVCIFPWCLFKGMSNSRGCKVAYVEHGKWANADAEWNLDHVTIRSAYAYSELAKLLSAERLSLTDLNAQYREAWMVTPTNPLSAEELSGLRSWVNQGGSLIIVTDHTDVFGHGRVANQILTPLGMSTDYTAFFPTEEDDQAKNGWFGNYQMRTTTTFRGYGIFPLITARWFNEAPDYSTKNFFGRLRATGEDEHMRRVVAGVRPYGRGRIVLMADSTMFSNFATYAPDSLRIAAGLRSPFSRMPLYSDFPLLLVLLGLGQNSVFTSKFTTASGCLLCSVMIAIGLPEKPGTLSWGRGENFLWWSGDSDLVQGAKDPSQSLTTAYIVSTLTERKPRWTDSTTGLSSGIWVSAQPPPSPAWRWISPNTNAGEVETDEGLFGPLYEALGASSLEKWSADLKPDELSAGGLWTNDVLGDEWFDRGVSPARLARFKALCAWINGGEIPARQAAERAVGSPTRWALKLPEREAILMDLPLLPGKQGDFVYLGRGLSAQWTIVAGKMCLVGLKPYMEKWDSPEIWVLQPVSK